MSFSSLFPLDCFSKLVVILVSKENMIMCVCRCHDMRNPPTAKAVDAFVNSITLILWTLRNGEPDGSAAQGAMITRGIRAMGRAPHPVTTLIREYGMIRVPAQVVSRFLASTDTDAAEQGEQTCHPYLAFVGPDVPADKHTWTVLIASLADRYLTGRWARWAGRALVPSLLSEATGLMMPVLSLLLFELLSVCSAVVVLEAQDIRDTNGDVVRVVGVDVRSVSFPIIEYKLSQIARFGHPPNNVEALRVAAEGAVFGRWEGLDGEGMMGSPEVLEEFVRVSTLLTLANGGPGFEVFNVMSMTRMAYAQVVMKRAAGARNDARCLMAEKLMGRVLDQYVKLFARSGAQAVEMGEDLFVIHLTSVLAPLQWAMFSTARLGRSERDRAPLVIFKDDEGSNDAGMWQAVVERLGMVGEEAAEMHSERVDEMGVLVKSLAAAALRLIRTRSFVIRAVTQPHRAQEGQDGP